MKEYIRERSLESAKLILGGNTIRKAAKLSCVSRSTIHLDVSERLLIINPEMYMRVKKVLKYNWDNKHIWGGEATAKKYLSLSKNKTGSGNN